MNKRGQIWVETVLYTLIGLVIIGMALGFIMPKINQAKDRALIRQSTESLANFDEKITYVLDGGSGNIRNINFLMKEGEFVIDGINDKISIVVNDTSKYSEVGVPIKNGRIVTLTSESKSNYGVAVVLDYSGIANVTYNGIDELKVFPSASVPYRFSISNNGVPADGDFVNIDLKLL